MPSDLAIFWKKHINPLADPVREIYMTYRRDKLFERDVAAKSPLPMPKLTSAQKNEIVDYYAQFGLREAIKPHLNYYRRLIATAGIFSPRYIPTRFQLDYIDPRFNDSRLWTAWADKSYLERFFGEGLVPYSVVRNINGIFFDHNYTKITPQKAIDLIKREDAVLIKTSIDSMSGKSINVYVSDAVSEEIFKAYGRNFVVQRVIEQHPVLSAFNESSVNTVRILSFNFKEDIHLLFAILRVGSAGSMIDNISAGGCGYKVETDGTVMPDPRIKDGSLSDHHYNGTVKSGTVKIPSYEEIKTLVKAKHLEFPHFGLMAWDITVDKDSKPVIVEINLLTANTPMQQLCGPMYGDLTEEVLEYAGENPPISDIPGFLPHITGNKK